MRTFFLLLPVFGLVIIAFVFLWRALMKMRRELKDFAEAVEYGDLTRVYPEDKPHFKSVYKSLNKVTRSINTLNRQREAQQQYLKKILELVDTGILAYHVKTLNVLWINDAFGDMLNIPLIQNMKWIQKQDEVLFNQLMEIPLGSNELITIKQKGQTVRVLTNSSLFESEGEQYKLIAFHNIKSVMEEVEANAWKGLLDVMTHEIMNSVAPVSSLADTLRGQVKTLKNENKLEDNPTVEDIEFALEAIQRRSDGLLRFSENYRSLSRKIVPDLKQTDLHLPLNSVCQLMEPSLKQKGIRIEIKSKPMPVMATIDQPLIEQVLINFITNATYALTERQNPCIDIFLGISEENKPYITVVDNGHGIPENIREKIFVPFFSTRKKGSGIGLSLSREIIKLHQADLHVQSKEGEGSAFTILFKD